MQIKASKKMLAVVFSASITAAIILAVFIIIDCVKYKDYINTEATVTMVCTDSSLTNSNGNPSVEKNAVCTYTVDGESYSQEYRLSLLHWITEGDTINIRVNPDNHAEIADMYSLKVKAYICMFFVAFGIMMTFALAKVE